MPTKKYGFIPALPRPGEYIHGDGLLGDVAINPGGHWSSWLPADELQNRGYETYSCVIEAELHCNEILERFKYGTAPQYSVRFLATMAGTGKRGGNDCQTVADTLRKYGCCQESDWPFTAADYNAFYTTPPANIITLAKRQFADNSPGNSWLTDTSPAAMLSALEFSPLSLAVFAWAQPDADGIYHRPKGAQDCHEIAVVDYQENEWWLVFDSYEQTHKKLAWDYGFGIGKRHTLDRVIPTSPTPDGLGWVNWTTWINYLRSLPWIPGG